MITARSARWSSRSIYTTGHVYRFDLVRTPDGWRLSGIETTAVWTSGTPIRPPQPN